MATRKPEEPDVNLPFAALQILAPPVRLVSAALWKVLRQKDVMQYGVVEEFVTSACESVPGLLTVRHQGKLALGLRARLILELCRQQPDMKVIEPHLKRFRVPAAASSSTVKKDVKLTRTVENFHLFVQTLIKDPAEREEFYKEEFPVEYGPKFDEELKKLLWEFLIRLDQLLPVPNLAQTVSWLSDTPPVLEQCVQAATQPQLLSILLQHQSCLGHLEIAASLPPNMGDSILDSLSLPPSGRVTSGADTSTGDQSGSTQTRGNTTVIKPVIGLISNKDVPVMISSRNRTQRAKESASTKEEIKKKSGSKGNSDFTLVKQRQKASDDEEEEEEGEEETSRGVKRKQAQSESEEEEEEDRLGEIRSKKKKKSGIRKRSESAIGADVATCLSQLGVKSLNLPVDPSLCSIFVSCLTRQPRVVVRKISAAPATHKERQTQRRRSPVKTPTRKSSSTQLEKPDSDASGLDDKENHPVLPGVSRSPQLWSNADLLVASGDGEDYVADSEDEATKNFKGRLFMKRYYKTKHGTYVPTLREFWRPGMVRRIVLSPGGKSR